MFPYEPAAMSFKALQDCLVGHIALYAYFHQNGADIRPVDKPQRATIAVALNHLCKIPAEVADHECTGVGALPTSPTVDRIYPVEDIVSPPV